MPELGKIWVLIQMAGNMRLETMGWNYKNKYGYSVSAIGKSKQGQQQKKTIP